MNLRRHPLGPATFAVVGALRSALTAADRSLLVACSGGADSLALAYAARWVAARTDRRLAATVVDHGLQDDSAQVAARAAGQLAELGYDDIVTRRVDVAASGGGGPEAAARSARYRALDEEAVARGGVILLGHTLDDQAETVLLGLARGSGPRSLAGMPVRRGRLVRPLLGIRRATTQACCEELGLTPWADPHNAEPRFARVRVRATVLPVLEAELGPGIAEALARTAELSREDTDLLDQLSGERHDAARVAYAVEGAGGGTELDCAVLAAEPAAIRRRILRRWLAERGLTELTAPNLQAVDRLLTDWHGQRGAEVPGGVVSRVDGRLRLKERR